tara:strand:+ start:7574 stop:8455 length:882 start_codon:yes stop_codon:yes gene_type:complete
MNIEYLNFRGFNITSNEKYEVESSGKGEFTTVPSAYSGVENTRTLSVNKSDVMSVYSYIPELADLSIEGQGCGPNECKNCLSYRVVLGLKNQGYLELNVVSEVPVNNIIPNGGLGVTLETTMSDKRALTIPFNSWVLNSNVTDFDCGDGIINNTINTVPAINGIQYQWIDEAIKAYFGIFDSNGPSQSTSVKELVSRWLETKVSNYLIANPGAPLTDVILGEVKDFTYDGVVYGGFKLRFGGIGIPVVTGQGPEEQPFTAVQFSKTKTQTYPFKWSDIFVAEESAGGPGPGMG